MLLIAYGIFAVLVIVILIVVNVRSSRRQANREGEEAAAELQPEPQPKPEPEPDTARQADPASTPPSAPPAPEPAARVAPDAPPAFVVETEREERAAAPAADAGRGGTKDSTYRQGLRRLRDNPGPERPSSARAKDEIISDAEYRKAMLNFRKSGEKKE